MEEYVKLNDLNSTITVASDLTAKVANLSLTYSVDGTYVWTHLEEECPQTLVQLYRGCIKIFSKRSTSLEAVPDGGQAEGAGAGLELGAMFMLCGNLDLHTSIPNIAVLAQQDHRREVATGKFAEQPVGANVT